MSRRQIQDALGLKHREHFYNAYLTPALKTGLVEMTLPDKPRSSKQRYRLSKLGQQWLQVNADEGSR
jgi:ATP-dependent DNA helicase RecG